MVGRLNRGPARPCDTARAVIEHDVEKYLFEQCRAHGFLALKFTSPARAGVPDRVIITPHRTLFVEVKRPGERPRRLQQEVIAQMRAAGGEVHVLDTFGTVDELIGRLTVPGTPPAPDADHGPLPAGGTQPSAGGPLDPTGHPPTDPSTTQQEPPR